MFFLATKCYIVDITSEENRTTRMAVIDAFFGVGYLIGLPIGTHVKKHFGYIPLFAMTLGFVVFAMLYTVIFLKDSYHLLTDEKKKLYDKQREENKIRWNKGRGY